MNPDFTSTTYAIYASWGPRPETAERLAARLRAYIDSMIELGPLFAKWRVGLKRGRLYEKVRDDLVKLFQDNIRVDDDGCVSPMEGYGMIGMAREQRDDRTFSFNATLGSVFDNSVELHTSYGYPADPAIIDYDLFKSLLLLTIDTWQPDLCRARPSDLYHHFHGSPFHEEWILYVRPDLAGTVQPIGIPVVETTPDGGLLLAATTEPFSTDNPVHLEAAHRIAAVTSHLNIGRGFQGPWPKRPDRPPPQKAPLSQSPPEVVEKIKALFGDRWRQLFADE